MNEIDPSSDSVLLRVLKGVRTFALKKISGYFLNPILLKCLYRGIRAKIRDRYES